MKRQIYLAAGRAVTPAMIAGLKLYTKITGTKRVRVIVTNEKNEVLLLKGVISPQQWTLPGGGINRHETAVAAAKRELHEETGISAPESTFEYVQTLGKPFVDIPFKAPLFRVTVRQNQLPDAMVNPREIAIVAWFRRDNLPAPLSQIAQFSLTKLDN